MCAGAIGETGLFNKRAGGAGSSLMGAALRCGLEGDHGWVGDLADFGGATA